MSSDSQAMGRIGEVILRTWQTAHKMKQQRGALPGDSPSGDDNHRIRRYVAKYTINPAIAHGVADRIGSVEVGKLAVFVVWHPAWFGVKPQLVIKGGFIAWAQIGDANASIPTPQPIRMRPMFGARGARPARPSWWSGSTSWRGRPRTPYCRLPPRPTPGMLSLPTLHVIGS